jgi:peptide/nickel transport system ATP-binding protein
MTKPVDIVRPGASAPPLLAVRGLCKSFTVRDGIRTKKLQVLRDVSFDVQRGEVVALVGESGSGKSTTARLVARLMPASAGEIWFDGREVLRTGVTRGFRSRVQMIFQDPFSSLNPVHTVGYHIERPLRVLLGLDAEAAAARTRELLETVGLTPPAEVAKKHPHQLSGGQRQRVAIARALAAGPDLILADEPTSMLDVSIRVGILNLMRGLRDDRGIAYLYITHDLASARYLADRTMVMYAGIIVEGGPSGQIMDAPAHPYTKLLLSAVPDARKVLEERAASGGATRPISSTATTALQKGSASAARPISTSGCPFADRCPEVHARCRTELPVLHAIAPGRTARCHLYSDGAARLSA